MVDAPPSPPRQHPRRRLVGGSAVAVALALGTAGGLTYGNRPLSLDDTQRATLSDEAAEHLEQMRPLFLPDLLTGALVDEARLVSEAESFAAEERVVEDELIERFDLKLTEQIIGGTPVTLVEPARIAPERAGQIAVNIHGGGFFLGTSRDRVGLLLAHELGIPVYSIEYTLAPEGVYPQPVDESLAVYRELVDQHDPADIIGIASSAGGNILTSTVLAAAEEDLPMIAGLALFTPVTDLTGVGDSIAANNRRDGLVANLRIDVPARFYAGDTPLDDPGLSPVYADIPEDFPPTILTTGTRDLNLSDIVRLSWRLEDAGIENRMLVGEGMWHGYHWEPDLPEAVQTRTSAVEFLHSQLDRSATATESPATE
jgi:monoterpene epsilon-lactone hydrolase